VCVQALRPQFAVGGLDETVIGRLARVGEIQCHIVGISPEVQTAGDEVTAVIYPNRLRRADLGKDRFKGLHDILVSVSEVEFVRRAEPGMGIEHRQDVELFVVRQLIIDAVLCPNLVRPDRLLAVFA
jgi:hypothetical protein